RLEGTVFTHTKRAHCAVAVGQHEEDSTVVALGHVDGMTAGSGESANTTRIQQTKGSIQSHPEPGDGTATGVCRVSEAAVLRKDQPTRGLLFSRHRRTDDGEIPSIRNRIGGS